VALAPWMSATMLKMASMEGVPPFVGATQEEVVSPDWFRMPLTCWPEPEPARYCPSMKLRSAIPSERWRRTSAPGSPMSK